MVWFSYRIYSYNVLRGGILVLDNLTRDDLPDSVMDIVDIIGIDAFKDLVRLAGGSNLYIVNYKWANFLWWVVFIDSD